MTAHALALLLVAIAADKPHPEDLAAYKAATKLHQTNKVAELTRAIAAARGARRQQLADELAAYKKAPSLPPLWDTSAHAPPVGSIGAMPTAFSLEVVETTDGRARAWLTINSKRLGKKPLVVETPEAKDWKAGEVVKLPANRAYWVKGDGSLAPLPK